MAHLMLRHHNISQKISLLQMLRVRWLGFLSSQAEHGFHPERRDPRGEQRDPRGEPSTRQVSKVSWLAALEAWGSRPLA